jgi:2-dehydro-3-deoxy-L-rhamnonate dehydrogenase (NAD+)
VVTGGARGIGLVTAERLRRDGVQVITVDLAGADRQLDVTDSAAVAGFAAEVGDIDILVNCAGILGSARPLWEIDDEEWDRVFRVNVVGTFAMCRAFVPGMRRRGWGRIVNLASMAAKAGNANSSHYSASKAAVITLTRSLAKEVARDGIIANSVAPALIETPLVEGRASNDEALSWIPMGRAGKPEEVAELIAWLASDAVSFSTGAVYDISGGRAAD